MDDRSSRLLPLSEAEKGKLHPHLHTIDAVRLAVKDGSLATRLKGCGKEFTRKVENALAKFDEQNPSPEKAVDEKVKDRQFTAGENRWNRKVQVGGFILAAAVAIGVAIYNNSSKKDEAAENRKPHDERKETPGKKNPEFTIVDSSKRDPQHSVALDLSGTPAKGADHAQIQILAFIDFECPFSKKALQSLHGLMKKHPTLLSFHIKHFPLEFHMHAKDAALFAIAAHLQGEFWPFVNTLLETREPWDLQAFLAVMDAASVDRNQAKADIRTRALAILDRDVAEGQSLGIHGTPTFVIQRSIVPGLDTTLEKTIIKELRERMGDAAAELESP